MKREFEIKIKVKRCDIVFKEELGPGIIASTTYIFDIDKKEDATMWLAMALSDYGDQLIEDVIEREIIERTP